MKWNLSSSFQIRLYSFSSSVLKKIFAIGIIMMVFVVGIILIKEKGKETAFAGVKIVEKSCARSKVISSTEYQKLRKDYPKEIKTSFWESSNPTAKIKSNLTADGIPSAMKALKKYLTGIKDLCEEKCYPAIPNEEIEKNTNESINCSAILSEEETWAKYILSISTTSATNAVKIKQLTTKLRSINNKLEGMVNDVSLMEDNFDTFANKVPCLIKKCI